MSRACDMQRLYRRPRPRLLLALLAALAPAPVQATSWETEATLACAGLDASQIGVEEPGPSELTALAEFSRGFARALARPAVATSPARSATESAFVAPRIVVIADADSAHRRDPPHPEIAPCASGAHVVLDQSYETIGAGATEIDTRLDIGLDFEFVSTPVNDGDGEGDGDFEISLVDESTGADLAEIGSITVGRFGVVASAGLDLDFVDVSTWARFARNGIEIVTTIRGEASAWTRVPADLPVALRFRGSASGSTPIVPSAPNRARPASRGLARLDLTATWTALSPGTSLEPILGAANDRDGDAVRDDLDNCVDVPNYHQDDADAGLDDDTSLPGIQHYGNVCDADLNNDGLVSPIDFFTGFKPCFGADTRDRPECRAADFDGDFLVSVADFFSLMRPGFGGPPGPGTTETE